MVKQRFSKKVAIKTKFPVILNEVIPNNCHDCAEIERVDQNAPAVLWKTFALTVNIEN